MTEAEDSNAASFDPVAQFLQRLDDEPVRKLTGIETTTQMAELLWLATHLEAPTSSLNIGVEISDKNNDLVAGDEDDWRPPPPPGDDTDPDLPPEDPAKKTKVDVVAPPPQLQKALPPNVLPVQVFDPAMLGDPQGIVKALKPLLQKIEVDTGHRLNEPETVDFIARTELYIPKLQPDREAWFDVIVVVDHSSASMVIWQRLVDDIVRILKRYGAFRDVRVYDLVIDPDAQRDKHEEPVMLRSRRDRPYHHPKELIDRQGRRLAIILSDTTAEHWWRGTVTETLEQWGLHMPLVLWQMLPPWLWQRTALGRGTPVSIRNALPGTANQRWKTRASATALPRYAQGKIAVPVVTSERYDLTRWSQLVVGKPVVVPGFLLPLEGDLPRTIARPGAPAPDEAGKRSEAEKRIDRFLRLASPEAQWLLMLLAAAPVITLPIVRLIRGNKELREKSQLPEVTSPLPIAEIFTSGLLQRVTEHLKPVPGNVADDEQTPSDRIRLAQDQVQYDFVEHVRQALLQGKWMTPPEAVTVINSVSREIEKRFNCNYPHTFQAYLKNPDIDLPEGLEGLKAFATITAEILQELGRPYAELAQQLLIGAEKRAVPVDPYGNRLLQFEYEVAEYLNIPEIIDITFSEGLLNDDTWPPALKPHNFQIATIELTPSDVPGEVLDSSPRPLQVEPFDFISATLTRNPETNAWEIDRQAGQADRYVEILPDDITLEMVSIPGGTFRMGSPEDEPKRSAEVESPQHDVTISPFFTGRYPVTQAQWRVIANLPHINRELTPYPSNFRGNNRPVEKVSWLDAVEFCARLSAYSDRTYRLPSEAEWEYACRAETTTPFHFGETISTELANYSGGSYNGGPKGDSRNGTTEIGMFPANNWGLYDMHGNVFEWCADDFYPNYEEAPADGTARAKQETDEYFLKIRRGGSWINDPGDCRSAYRNYNFPDIRNNSLIGFRVVCAPKTLRKVI